MTIMLNDRCPAHDRLPRLCYAVHPSQRGEIVMLQRGREGYWQTTFLPNHLIAEHRVERLNEQLGVTKAQAAAMEAGSMFGFHVPGADPDHYDENGRFRLHTVSA